jgi:hypothetical protein
MKPGRRLSRKNFVFPSEFDHLLHVSGTTSRGAAKLLHRHLRTIEDWRHGKRPVPLWAFRLVYLEMYVHRDDRLDSVRYRTWHDFREFFAPPVNESPFVAAMRPVMGSVGGSGHAVPTRPQAGQAAVPPGAHDRREVEA